MATQSELQAQLNSTNNAIAILQKQLANAKPGSTDQTQLSISLYNLQQQQQATQQQLATTTPATPSNPAAYDDQGVLQYGWHINEETGQPYYNGNADVPQTQKEPTVADDGTTDGIYNTGAIAAGTDHVADDGTTAGINDVLKPQPNADNGEDPYVMNGASTIAQQTQAGDDGTTAGINEVIQGQKQPAITGAAYDDEGNLMPGWTLDEDNNPVYVGGNFVEPATQDLAVAGRDAAKKAAAQKEIENAKKNDWRVRLSLAPKAGYLYNAGDIAPTDILWPLKGTGGVIFPYTPTIQTSYKANYEPAELLHSNYKYFFYKNSAVDDVTINATFTAQDTMEANYLLAVIHFFKSVTKMFYGQDKNPVRGTPPPLCYLTGLGSFQFDNHPLLISNFSYSLPNDVDYIRAGSVTTWGGVNIGSIANKGNTNKYIPGLSDVLGRLSGAKLQFGGVSKQPNFTSLSTPESTYVPTKLDITITAHPVVTRNDISNTFSVAEYAKGNLLKGSKRSGGGIW